LHFFVSMIGVLRVTILIYEKHLPNQPIAIGRVVGIGDVSHLYAGGEPVSSSGLFSKMP